MPRTSMCGTRSPTGSRKYEPAFFALVASRVSRCAVAVAPLRPGGLLRVDAAVLNGPLHSPWPFVLLVLVVFISFTLGTRVVWWWRGYEPMITYYDPGPAPVSVLVLDLDDDGVELLDLRASSALLDADGDGFAEHTAWVGPEDGILAADRDGNGRIDGVAELFGSLAADGFAELARLDSDGDGVIRNAEAGLKLLVWRDRDGDERSAPHELAPLAGLGRVALDLRTSELDEMVAGQRITRASTFARPDGTEGRIVNVRLARARHF